MKPEEVIKYLEMVRPTENYSHTFSVSVGNTRHFGPGSQLNKDVSTAIDLAIQALEKQVPKKPTIPTISMSVCLSKEETTKLEHCPECGEYLRDSVGNEHMHCSDCGQRIDWSEIDE